MIEDNLKSIYILSDGNIKSYEKRVIENIKASQKIRCDINLERDPGRMLDLALLCISIMTGDTVFYNKNKDKLINIMCN